MAIRPIAETAGEAAFFAGLDPGARAVVGGCASHVRFRPGDYLFHEGAPAERFYLLRHGRAAVEVRSPGKGAMVLATLGPGQIVGVSWLTPPYRWTYDARAVEEIRATAFDAACLRARCDADPGFGYALMQRFLPMLIERLQASRLQMLDVYGQP